MNTGRKAKNEKNQFLCDHFDKELRKQQFHSNQNMKFCLHKILKSLTKYPLPILSAQQAVMLEGVGEKSAATIGNLCRQQYDQYVQPTEQIETLSQSKQISGLNSEPYTQQDKILHEDSGNEFISFIQNESQNQQNQSKSKKKIDANSNSWAILISLYVGTLQMSVDLHFFCKKEINTQAESTFPCEIKSFNSMNTLIKWLYVDKLVFGNEVKFSLTKEGKIVAEQLYNNRMLIYEQDIKQPSQNLDAFQYTKSSVKKKETKKKTKKQKISTVREVHSEDEKSQKDESQKKRRIKSAKKTKIKPKLEQEQIQQKNIKSEEINEQPPIPAQIPQNQSSLHILQKEDIEKYQILLIVDNREIFKRDNDDARKAIQSSIREKYGIQDCQIGQLPIGDFMWVIKIHKKNEIESQIYVLDTIIERKTLDDLASSIVDQRYKDQKQRLKKCGLKHIYYLIEGNKGIPMTSIESAITTTQICDGFKIKKTQSMIESIDFLAKLHLLISKRFKNHYQAVNQISFEVTLDQFLLKNTKHLNHTISNIFGNMLKSIKQCSQESTQQIIDLFPTPLSLIKQIQSQGTTEQKKEFIKQVCPAIKNQKLVQNIVTLFSFDMYPNILDI